MLSADALRRATGAFDLGGVARVSVAGQGLVSLDGIEVCARLEQLDASGNKIASLSPLSQLIDLRLVALAGNQIESLAGVEGLEQLQELGLQGNRISSLDELARLRACSSLRSLWLANADGSAANPVCDELAYRSTLLKLLPALQSLDGVRVRVAREVFGAADANAHAAPARPSGPDTAALIASLSNVQPWLPRETVDAVAAGVARRDKPTLDVDTSAFQEAVRDARAELARARAAAGVK